MLTPGLPSYTERPTGALFSGGAFQGSMHQIAAIAATVRVRDALEPIHGGDQVGAKARVVWQGGACRYGETARIAPSWLDEFSARMTQQICDDMLRMQKPSTAWDLRDIQYRLNVAGRWGLPQVEDVEIDGCANLAKASALMRSGRSRGPRDRLMRALKEDDPLRGFLGSFTKGEAGPAEAALAGQEVLVEAEGEMLTWDEIGHLDNRDMASLNRGLSGRIYALLIALERACGRREFEMPFNFPEDGLI